MIFYSFTSENTTERWWTKTVVAMCLAFMQQMSLPVAFLCREAVWHSVLCCPRKSFCSWWNLALVWKMKLSEHRCCAWCVCVPHSVALAAEKQVAELGLPCLGRAELTVGHLEMQKELKQGDVSVGACLDTLVYLRASFRGEGLCSSESCNVRRA